MANRAARRAAGVLGLALVAGSASPAWATWSIVIVDTRTGEVAVASCTCLTGFDLQANTPVLLTGIGGATAQSSVDADGVNRVFIRDRLLEGVDPEDILGGLAVFDASHQTRQYGIVDVLGRTATFTGTGAGTWKGGRTGHVGTLAYAVQGNVLSGSPVVDMAVAAIEGTDGDMPLKLMKAMEAARQFGGDGRCSCNPGQPESCGPTPPSFTKAAHVGYMLIARAGDRDGSNSIYKTARTPLTAVAADFDHDGRLDLAVPGSNGPAVSVLLSTYAGTGPITYAPAIDTPTGGSPRDLAVADFNHDGKLDIATANFSADSMSLLLGLGDGHFTPAPTVPLGDGPIAVVTADFNRDTFPDLAFVNNLGASVTILTNNGSGAFTSQTVTVGATPNSIIAADDDGDGDMDLFVACTGAKTIQILRNNAGVFTAEPGIPTTVGTWNMAAADFDGDGDLDLAFIATTEAVVRVMLKGPTGYGAATTYSAGSQPWEVVARDMTGDHIPDLVVSNRTARTVSILRGRGDGTFDAAVSYPVGYFCQRFALADLDGDGDDDIAIAQPSNTSVNALQNFGAPGGPAQFQDISGCATGAYFMEFNVPVQMASDPDPVFTLRAMFDAWRTGLIGVPDAVQSEAELDRDLIPADGASTATLTIRPRDWQLTPVIGASVVVEKATGVGLGIGPVTAQPDGSFLATITSGTSCGEAQLRITATAGGRAVIFMPCLKVTVAPRADLTGDGIADFSDVLEYLNLYDAADPRADLNGDGVVDVVDYQTFLERLGAGC